MDRRTLLALVLSALVLVVWAHFFAPKPSADRTAVSGRAAADSAASLFGDAAVEHAPGEPAAPLAGDAAGRAREDGARGAAASGAAGGRADVAGGTAGIGRELEVVPDWQEAPEEIIHVDTDVAQLAIATIGGGLVGSQLLGYPSGADPSEHVDLVRPGQQVLDLSLVWRDPDHGTVVRREPLGRAGFRVVEDRVERGRPLAQSEAASPAEEAPFVRHLTLEARRADGLVVTRTYTFHSDSYQFEHVVRVDLPSGSGPPPDQIVVGWRAGLAETEKPNGNFRMRGTMNAVVLVGEEMHEWKPGSFKKSGEQVIEGKVRWAVVRNKYFVAALVPADGTATAVHANGDASSKRNEIWIDVPLSSATGWRAGFEVYVGPSDYGTLKALGSELERTVRLGPRVLRPLGRIMLGVIKGSYRVIPNYGLVIILVSVLIRLAMHPLNQKGMRSMKAMQDLQPQMKEIRKKYADDAQEMNRRVMELYKQHGANPLSGCWPMFLQMPFLFALYYVLMFSVDLRMAPFVLWIDDLSAPDTIAKIFGFDLHVLPLVMTGVSVLQARSTPKDPRQAAMTTMMPVIFLFLFYSMPSGLVLYWTVMNTMAWIQQAMVNKGDTAKKVALVVEGGGGAPEGDSGAAGAASAPPALAAGGAGSIRATAGAGGGSDSDGRTEEDRQVIGEPGSLVGGGAESPVAPDGAVAVGGDGNVVVDGRRKRGGRGKRRRRR